MALNMETDISLIHALLGFIFPTFRYHVKGNGKTWSAGRKEDKAETVGVVNGYYGTKGIEAI